MKQPLLLLMARLAARKSRRPNVRVWQATTAAAVAALIATNVALPSGLQAAGLVGDLNGDGVVGIQDLSILLANWSKSTPTATPTYCASPLPGQTGGCFTPRPTTTATPVASATATPATGTSPSGEAMPAAAPSGWKRVFQDDFTTAAALGQFPSSAAYKGRWAAYDGFNDTSKNGTYSSSKTLSVAGGMLDIYLHSEGNTHYVAAPTANNFVGQTYGRYSVRFKSDPVKGYKTAWLLWPSSDVWNDGEIDFPEGDLDGTIAAFSHCAGNNPSQNCISASSSAKFTSWHTATTEWTPGRVTFYLDGKQIGTGTAGVPTKPMRWTLQTETSLGGAAPSSSAAGHVSIDWVTIDAMQ